MLGAKRLLKFSALGVCILNVWIVEKYACLRWYFRGGLLVSYEVQPWKVWVRWRSLQIESYDVIVIINHLSKNDFRLKGFILQL